MCSADSDDDETDSDCGSEHSIYQLVRQRSPFVRLNIMILMEYAEGKTLRELMDSVSLTRGQIFGLFNQLIAALKQIHTNGLVHRDIKPENIFVNKRTNRLQVGDFGLAKCLKITSESLETKNKDNS
jgi:eukaryotic translation initiation factor 2-alpha kinase 4